MKTMSMGGVSKNVMGLVVSSMIIEATTTAQLTFTEILKTMTLVSILFVNYVECCTYTVPNESENFVTDNYGTGSLLSV
jgi:hypothetical protein